MPEINTHLTPLLDEVIAVIDAIEVKLVSVAALSEKTLQKLEALTGQMKFHLREIVAQPRAEDQLS